VPGEMFSDETGQPTSETIPVSHLPGHLCSSAATRPQQAFRPRQPPQLGTPYNVTYKHFALGRTRNSTSGICRAVPRNYCPLATTRITSHTHFTHPRDPFPETNQHTSGIHSTAPQRPSQKERCDASTIPYCSRVLATAKFPAQSIAKYAAKIMRGNKRARTVAQDMNEAAISVWCVVCQYPINLSQFTRRVGWLPCAAR